MPAGFDVLKIRYPPSVRTVFWSLPVQVRIELSAGHEAYSACVNTRTYDRLVRRARVDSGAGRAAHRNGDVVAAFSPSALCHQRPRYAAHGWRRAPSRASRPRSAGAGSTEGHRDRRINGVRGRRARRCWTTISEYRRGRAARTSAGQGRPSGPPRRPRPLRGLAGRIGGVDVSGGQGRTSLGWRDLAARAGRRQRDPGRPLRRVDLHPDGSSPPNGMSVRCRSRVTHRLDCLVLVRFRHADRLIGRIPVVVLLIHSS